MQVINVRNMTEKEITDLDLSFYTLCKWADCVMLVYPMQIANFWTRGLFQQWKGILTLDDLGNFISFE